jgi:RNA polymerase sigma-70 factor (ECF subfamily)
MNFTDRPQQLQEEELVRMASQGDLEAFNQLVLVYQNLAYSLAYSLLGDHASAEDAAQESFIKAFQNLDKYRGGSFRAWLLRIVTNSAYDTARRSRRHPAQPLFPEDENGEDIESSGWLADPAPSVQETVEQKEFSRSLYRMLDDLPDAYRSVITLVDVDGLDYQEAAQVLSLPLGTVKSRLARARDQMRSKLKERYGSSARLNMTEAGYAI